MLGLTGDMRCQPAPPKRSEFAVASIKLEKNCVLGTSGRAPAMNPGTFRMPCLPVRVMIRMAYSGLSGADLSVNQVQVLGGPAWIDSDTYTIDAKAETPSTAAEMMGPMLQSLLEDRFRLKIHTEPRETPVYLLTVAEPSPTLRATKNGDCVPIGLFQDLQKGSVPSDSETPRSGPGQCGERRMTPSPTGVGTVLDWHGVTMAEFVSRFLAGYARRPVVDNTGLKGRFDLRLDFDPAQAQGSGLINGQAPLSQEDSSTESSNHSIFTALRKQLGLKLTSGKSPLDVIVIDHVERPTEN